MPTIDSTDRDFHDYLTGANTGVAYNGMSAAGAATYTSPTSAPLSTVRPGSPAPGGMRNISLPDIDAPIWLRIVTGAIFVEAVEAVTFATGEALKHRLTLWLAIICGVAALIYGLAVGVPLIVQQTLPYAEASFAAIGFALPYGALIALFVAGTVLGTLMAGVLTLALNLLRLALVLGVVAAIGYGAYYMLVLA
ncbi:hypothetical protein N0B44_28000 [Roseibacterium beibuensis]|uniref:Yip1 domain-containing protein n=2 Tax=[Roseibacterium] beibuensis TaxID=1193142 RepID=A0ABP9LM65_9RHOB|nr:hypothetical protein [Roseibacterium beibuensis]